VKLFIDLASCVFVSKTNSSENNVFLISPVRDSQYPDEVFLMYYVAQLEAQGKKVHYPLWDTKQGDPIGMKMCEQNRDVIRNASEVHLYWTPGSDGSKFDLGMGFMARKPLKIVNREAVKTTPYPSLANFVLALDGLSGVPPNPVARKWPDEHMAYILCPEWKDFLNRDFIEDYVRALESFGTHVYYPPREDAIDDVTCIAAYSARRAAMEKSRDVHVLWTCNNNDNKFDLGMAFMAEKPVCLTRSIPPTDGKKSFNNVLRALDEIYKKPQ
jgi:hypothetical protein